jgi:GNAT superfamily N-acetyltransferase
LIKSECGAVETKRGDGAEIVALMEHSQPENAVTIRPAEARDVPAMAAIRAAEWGTQGYWMARVEAYWSGTIWAREALPESAMFVAEMNGLVVGLVAGHRTTRHGCQGELEWINVARTQQRAGVAGKLLAAMAAWFVEHKALRVCVDVEPGNIAARAFYAKHGAIDLKPSWMEWEDVGVVLRLR